MRTMTACAVLAALGCGSDPIIYKAQEATATELVYMGLSDAQVADARLVRITYWKNESLVHGTLAGMVEERFTVELNDHPRRHRPALCRVQMPVLCGDGTPRRRRNT